MRRLRAALAGLLLLGEPVHAGNWPHFRKDPERKGYSNEQTAPPLALRWQYSTGGAVLSSPVVAYNRVFVGSRSNSVYCLDAYTGAVIWSYATGNWVDATPAVSDGRVFVPSRDGKLYAFDAMTGSLLWSYTTGSTDQSSPAAYGGEVFAATGHPNKKLLVIDAKTGLVKRQAALSQFTASSPVLDTATGRLYIGTNDGRYTAFNSDMSSLWANPVQTRGGIQLATPALYKGKLLALPGDDDWRTHAYDSGQGFEVWTSTTLCSSANQATSVSVTLDTAYAGSNCGNYSLYAMSLSSGGIKWKVPMGTAGNLGVASSPALANDMAYVLSPSGELYGVQTSTGGVQVKVALSGQGTSSPAVANGWVYAATMNGIIYGFESERTAVISSPDPALDSASGIVTIKGSVLNPALDRYRVEFGTGTNPASWTLLAESTAAVRRGSLGSWDTRETPDGIYTLRLSVTETASSGFSSESLVPVAIAQLSTSAIDAAVGGTITLSDGTELVVPAGALPAGDTLTVRRLFSGYATSGLPQAVVATGIVREFKVASTPRPKFLKPVTLKIPYHTFTPNKEENLRLFYYDDEKAKWMIVNTGQVRPSQKKIWAEVDHFTNFQVMEFVPSDTLLEETAVYAYPNPASGDSVTFKFQLGDTSDVDIRVFDVSGALVAKLSRDGNLGGTIQTIVWDISGKASGVYLFHVEAKTASGKKTSVKKKLAIIH